MKHYRTTLKNSLLATAICACVTVTTATDAEDFATPNRNAEMEERVQVLAMTEGQKVSLKQAEVLSYQRLRGVLGDDFLSFATTYFGEKDEAEMATQWDAIFNVNIPYNDAQKRNILPKLLKVVDQCQGQFDELQALQADLFKLDRQTKQVPLTRIEESTREYFESVFKGCKVATSWKRGGDQLGRVAEVTLPNQQILTYFVKTHSGGLRSGHSSAAKLVNPSELLVYKVLEGLGIGPQSHFFGRDGHNLYIATLDAGMQPSADGKTLTQVPFKEYEYFKNDQQDPSVQAQLWGDLSQLPTDVDFSEVQHQQAEVLVNAEGGIARNFVHEVAKLDVIARIMRLTDFQTNPGNYGFIPGSDGRLKAKAIDFRLNSTDPNEIRFGEHFFKGFLNGNGYFDYSSTGKAMYYALRKRQQHLRVQETRTVMDGELELFESVVDRAAAYVLETLSTQIPMTQDDQTSRKIELNQYAEIIKSNFRLFRDQLRQWRPSSEEEGK